MKTFFKVLLILTGIAAVLYIATQKQTEARRIWNDVLAKVPSPAGCCDDCCSDD